MARPALSEPPLEQHLADLRPELSAYCYRMLGSTFDADDAVQETLLRAWRGAGTFEGRATVRSWLYRIATNVCLSQLQRAQRRALPMDLGAEQNQASTLGTPRPSQTWVEPIPDSWVVPPDLDPAQVVVRRESVRLAFVAALQLLPPRQRAVLLLRDVLRWRTAEVAELLGTSADAVNGALRRARATLATAHPRPTTAPDQHHDRGLLARYVAAFERFDMDALVGLLAEEATLSMPPYPLWLRGPAAIRRWFQGTGSGCRDGRLVPVAASGAAGFAVYRRSLDGTAYEDSDATGGAPPMVTTADRGLSAFALQVVETTGGRITALHIFLDPTLFRAFELPPTLSPTVDSSRDRPRQLGPPSAERRKST